MSVENCPRCGNPFECRKSDISHCDCSKLKLSETTLQFLSKTNYGCLCNACLFHFDKEVKRAAENQAIGGRLKENIHYYMENGLLVFTELYHISKGFCCKNGCRHCPYGFKA